MATNSSKIVRRLGNFTTLCRHHRNTVLLTLGLAAGLVGVVLQKSPAERAKELEWAKNDLRDLIDFAKDNFLPSNS